MRVNSPGVSLVFVLGVLVLLILFLLLQFHIVTFAFEKLGFSTFGVFLILFGSLFGSLINIPIKEIPIDPVAPAAGPPSWGMRYGPPQRPNHTLLTVNVGGAVIPAVVSLLLWSNGGKIFTPLLAIAAVALVVYRVARPTPGLGIATPIFVPPLAALLVAFLISAGDAPRLAYISGTLGTLIGADLMHLRKIPGLRASVASIGGAGTFDGIFITGVLAVLFA